MIRRGLIFLLATIGLAVIVALLASAAGGSFPHPRHEGLFDDCLTCHDGIPAGDRDAFYSATAEDCETCHDGETLDPVPWPAPEPMAAGNLIFDHALHVGDMEIECGECHGEPGAENPMEVGPAAAERCLPCHEAPAHLAPEAECATCHIPLVQATSLPASRIAEFPQAESHQDPGFVFEHGAAAVSDLDRCATCHARDLCETCHVDGELVEAIRSLERDPRVADLVTEREIRPPGHDRSFLFTHGATVASGGLKCASCHAPDLCESCHQGATRPGFHPRNFFFRHAAEAYARDSDCQSCHTTEVFCRDCHNGVGISPTGRVNSSYHDAQPQWLLTHGRAARQDLASCASCHQQTDCLKCHSAKTGWRINPHGPGFEADHLAERSPLMCSRCHFNPPR